MLSAAQVDPDFFDRFTRPTWDLPLWRSLVEGLGGPVLELGCGTGRVLADLHARGHEAYGVEREPALAARARAGLGEAGGARVWTADWLREPPRRRFPLVLIPCNTLSLFSDPAPALAAAAGYLAPGGALFFDLVVPGGRPWGAPPYTWSGRTEALEEGGRYHPDVGRHDGWMRSGDQRTTRTTWYRPLGEWPGLIEAAGLQHVRTFGPDGAPADDSASIAVLFARG